MKKFIILAQPRTGSTLVTSLIHSGAPAGIRCINEPINPVGHKHHMQPAKPENKERHALIPDEIIQNDICRALDLCYTPTFDNVSEDMKNISWVKRKIDGRVAAGFKIMAHQIMALKQEKKFWEYLHRYDIRTIVVRRSNILMQWISDLIVKKTRQCVVWNGPVKRAKVEVPIEDLEDNINRITREEEYLLDRSRLLDRRILIYEHFRYDYKRVEELLPWLIGVKYPVIAHCSKQNSDELAERVTNIERLQAKLEQLGLVHLLK